MRELAEASASDDRRSPGRETIRSGHWQTVRDEFEDKTNFFPVLHRPEIWRSST